MLGPYEVDVLLGAGGMGEVYRARDTRLGRTVAIKVLLSGLTASSERRARFEREARAISALSNPRICALYDVGRAGDIEYLVMEYIEGETLADRIARGRLPLSHVLRYGVEIAHGGQNPRWRRDSGELFYLSPQNAVMSVVPRGNWNDTTNTELFRAPADTLRFAASPDGQSFLFIEGKPGAADSLFHCDPRLAVA